MLNAIHHHKTRGSVYAQEPMEELYQSYEDLLTASIWERIGYLPDSVIWHIVKKAFAASGSAEMPLEAGALEAFSFWPSWTFKEGRVEPDVFLQFETCDVIVEAKRLDDADQQNPEQLAKELTAYFTTYPNRGSICVGLLAVGGLPDYEKNIVTRLRDQVLSRVSATSRQRVKFGAISWSSLYRVLEPIVADSADTAAGTRLLRDMKRALALHHIEPRDRVWLADLPQGIQSQGLNISLENYDGFAPWPRCSPELLVNKAYDWSIGDAYGRIQQWRIQ